MRVMFFTEDSWPETLYIVRYGSYFHSSIYSFIEYILSDSSVPGTMLDSRATLPDMGAASYV